MSKWTTKWDLHEAGLGNRMLAMPRRQGFLSCITKAERGYGKSMYNIMSMAYVFYHYLGCTEDEAWRHALDNIIFTPDELMNRVEQNIYQDKISLAWCIDDATVHFSSYLYFINLYQTSLLNAAFDTMRTVVHSLLINCPNKSRLLSGLRNYDDYEVTLYITDKYDRKAVGIKWYSLPDGHRKFRKEFEDAFSVFVPNWVYDEYMILRKRYLKEISEELKRLRDQLTQKKALEKTVTAPVSS